MAGIGDFIRKLGSGAAKVGSRVINPTGGLKPGGAAFNLVNQGLGQIAQDPNVSNGGRFLAGLGQGFAAGNIDRFSAEQKKKTIEGVQKFSKIASGILGDTSLSQEDKEASLVNLLPQLIVQGLESGAITEDQAPRLLQGLLEQFSSVIKGQATNEAAKSKTALSAKEFGLKEQEQARKQQETDAKLNKPLTSAEQLKDKEAKLKISGLDKLKAGKKLSPDEKQALQGKGKKLPTKEELDKAKLLTDKVATDLGIKKNKAVVSVSASALELVLAAAKNNQIETAEEMDELIKPLLLGLTPDVSEGVLNIVNTAVGAQGEGVFETIFTSSNVNALSSSVRDRETQPPVNQFPIELLKDDGTRAIANGPVGLAKAEKQGFIRR